MKRGANRLAVLDLETTGFFAEGHDRVVEIAVVQLDSDCAVVSEYVTLVNPQRDLGPTRIHGIEAWEMTDAPCFSDIVGDLVTLLRDTIIVAHNATFDLRFINAEFARSGYGLPPVPYACTLRLAAGLAGDAPSRRLKDLCDCFDVPLAQGHSALHDARATAGLLKVFLQAAKRKDLAGWAGVPYKTYRGNGTEWPLHAPCNRVCIRGAARTPVDRGADLVSRLVERLPHDSGESGEVEEYLILLDEVLGDRRITADESDMLFALALDLALSRDQVMHAHAMYLEAMVCTALADGVLSEFESRDLHHVSKILSLSPEVLEQTIARVRAVEPTTSSKPPVSADNLSGRSVCFTGELTACVNGEPVTRDTAELLATDRGMIVKSGVSRKLDFLVAADPDSNSGKARKARDYGVRVISEAQFWRMLGIQVE